MAAIRRRPSDVLLVLGFGYLAFSYVRNLTMFALVAYGPICLAAERVLQRVPRLRFAAPAALLGVAAALIAAPTWGAARRRAGTPAPPPTSSCGTSRRGGSSTSSTPAGTSPGGSCPGTRWPSTAGTTMA